MTPVHERGSTDRRRAVPHLDVVLGVFLPVLAAAVANGLWDQRYLLIPATWLLASVVVAALLFGGRAGPVAAIVATIVNVWSFVPPRWSLRLEHSSDVVAACAFAILAAGVALAIELVERARHRSHQVATSLDALLTHAPVGFAFLDEELRFVRVNDVLARIDGIPVEDHLGRTLDEVLGRPDVTALARTVLDTGEALLDQPIAGQRPDGEPVHVVAGFYPVRGDGDTGVGVVAHDVTSALRAERQRDELLERVTRLQRITGAMAGARTTDDVVRVVLDDVRRAVGADAASLAELDDGRIEIVGAAGYAADVLARWAHMTMERATPLGEAARTGRLVVARSHDEIVRRWPAAAPDLAEQRQALAVLPLLADGAVRGGIFLSFDQPMTFAPQDEAFLVAVGTQCADALLRARLHESEQRAHADAEAAADRLAFLAEASDALASSLDWETTFRLVADLAVPRLADVAIVFLVEGDQLRPLEIVHRDPQRTTALRGILERWPPHLHQRMGLGAIARTGEVLLVSDLDDAAVRAGARDEQHGDALVSAGFRSVLAVPMRGHDQSVGLIALATERPRRLGEADLALAMELATRAGQAVINARLFRERSHIAETLQASLLPPATPAVPGLDVATRFFAVGAGIDVGGDFYDVFRLGTATEPQDRWAVVIGDVRGKGTEAASISGAARHAIRVSALHESSPAAILERLNELLLVMAEDDPEPRFCTAIVAVIEPRETNARVTMATGGHPPPLLLDARGTARPVDVHGSLLGVLDEPDLSDVTFDLDEGEALVLYTDGVTERHTGNRFFDEEGLEALLTRCAGFTAAALAERIETASRAYVEDAPRDDLAIVVVRAPTGVASSTTSTSADLPADVGAPMLARRFVNAAFENLGGRPRADTAALLASELVTNALLHASGPFRIAVEPGAGSTIRISVSDGSERNPRLLDPGIEDVGGRGLRLLDNLATRWGVIPTTAGKTVWFELES